MRIDAERARDIRITLVEGLQLLGSFDVRLREYAARKLHQQGVHLVKVAAPPSQMDPQHLLIPNPSPGRSPLPCMPLWPGVHFSQHSSCAAWCMCITV